jgi:hypothetical protein
MSMSIGFFYKYLFKLDLIIIKRQGGKTLINADKSESVIFIATATGVIRILHRNTVLETSKK